MSLVLNKRNIEALPFEPKEKCYTDSNLPGFGVRVGKTTKSFYVEKRVHGKPKRITLGQFPILTADAARTMALVTLAELAQGKTPTLQKEASSGGEATASQQEDEYKSQARRITVQKVLEDYLELNKHQLSPQTVYDYRKVFRLYLSELMDTPLEDITPKMIKDLYLEKTTRAKHSTTEAFQKLRALYNFAMRYYIVESDHDEEIALITRNPVLVLTKNKTWIPRKRRKSVIPRKRLGTWVREILAIKETTVYENMRTGADYYLTLLLTGMRRTECAKLEWCHIDLESGFFTLVEANTKNGKEIQLPMSDFLWSLMLERYACRISKYVFPGSHTKSGHLEDVRHVMEAAARNTGVRTSYHDLRRTFASIAEFIGLPNFTIKRLMNHALDGDVTGGYISDRFDDDSLRTPTQQITDFVLGEAGFKEQPIASFQFLPIDTSTYIQLQSIATKLGTDIESLIKIFANGFERYDASKSTMRVSGFNGKLLIQTGKP